MFYLGLEGWRHADTRYPRLDACLPGELAQEASLEPPGRDWNAQGQAWLARTVEAGWWRDPELSLDRLARHLGTNTAYLSRAFNEGLGLSFNAAINRLRVDAVCQQLRASAAGDLLQLAFESGFSSKSSFNRYFKAQTGLTPSQYRESSLTSGARS